MRALVAACLGAPLLVGGASKTKSKTLCPSAAHGGSFIGLVADEVYTVRAPLDGSPERWEVVKADAVTGDKLVANSFCGVYLQVLPDDGDDYNDVYGAQSFVWTALEFELRVEAAAAYTLFARWSGGDTVGGGDSFYVVLADADGNLVEGAPKPLKEAVPKDEAEEIKAKIEEAGGQVDIK